MIAPRPTRFLAGAPFPALDTDAGFRPPPLMCVLEVESQPIWPRRCRHEDRADPMALLPCTGSPTLGSHLRKRRFAVNRS
jgi:hypothetical protein